MSDNITKATKGRFEVGDIVHGTDGRTYLVVPDKPHRLTAEDFAKMQQHGAAFMRLADANGRNAGYLTR